LRIVSDHLWYGANEVVDKRRVFQKPVRGAGHPLRGTTRQRLGLLAGVFNCGVCGAPMYSYGKQDGSFRCSASATGTCWNRVYWLRRDCAAHASRGARGAVPTADREARPGVAVVQQALAKGGRPQGRRQTPSGFLTSGTRGRRRRLRLRSPDFMAGGGLPIPGVLDDGREIVSKLFRDASSSRVNVFDRRVAIRGFLCHRSATPPACR